MAILSALRVSDVQDLRSEASNFQMHADELKLVTEHMLQLVESTRSVWRGNARERYSTQFEGLRDDMAKVYDMCAEYSTDLLEIAMNYESMETDNESTAGGLKADIELR